MINLFTFIPLLWLITESRALSNKDSLNLAIVDVKGQPLEQVEAGTKVRAIISLSSSVYNSELPEFCSVSDAKHPSGTVITVIANYCPYPDTMFSSSLNFVAYQQDNDTYYFEFNAFTFNNIPTTLLIQCRILVCLKTEDCYRPCWTVKPFNQGFSKVLEYQERRYQPKQNIDTSPNQKQDQFALNGPSASRSFDVIPKGSDPFSTASNESPNKIFIILVAIYTFFYL